MKNYKNESIWKSKKKKRKKKTDSSEDSVKGP